MHLNHGLNEAILKKILNLAEFLEYTYLAVFGWFLGPTYSDLFFDCFVETVFQIHFFWVQRSLLFGQLKFWLIEGLRGSGPPQYQHFWPFLEFMVFSSLECWIKSESTFTIYNALTTSWMVTFLTSSFIQSKINKGGRRPDMEKVVLFPQPDHRS